MTGIERERLRERLAVGRVASEMERHCLGVEGMEDSPVARWARELREALGAAGEGERGAQDADNRRVELGERRGCGQIVHCRECKFGEEAPPTMFCRLLYEEPDWNLPEHCMWGEPCVNLEVSPDDFCSWGKKRQYEYMGREMGANGNEA